MVLGFIYFIYKFWKNINNSFSGGYNFYILIRKRMENFSHVCQTHLYFVISTLHSFLRSLVKRGNKATNLVKVRCVKMICDIPSSYTSSPHLCFFFGKKAIVILKYRCNYQPHYPINVGGSEDGPKVLDKETRRWKNNFPGSLGPCGVISSWL